MTRCVAFGHYGGVRNIGPLVVTGCPPRRGLLVDVFPAVVRVGELGLVRPGRPGADAVADFASYTRVDAVTISAGHAGMLAETLP